MTFPAVCTVAHGNATCTPALCQFVGGSSTDFSPPLLLLLFKGSTHCHLEIFPASAQSPLAVFNVLQHLVDPSLSCTFRLIGHHFYVLLLQEVTETYPPCHLLEPNPNSWYTCTYISPWRSTFISLVATRVAPIAFKETPLEAAIYVQGCGVVCRVYVGSTVHIRVVVVPYTFLAPSGYFSATNLPFTSWDSRQDMTKSATTVACGYDDRLDPSNYGGGNPNDATFRLGREDDSSSSSSF